MYPVEWKSVEDKTRRCYSFGRRDRPLKWSSVVEWDLPRRKVTQRLNIRNLKAGNPPPERIPTAENSTMSLEPEASRDKEQEVSNRANAYSNPSRTVRESVAQESSDIVAHFYEVFHDNVCPAARRA